MNRFPNNQMSLFASAEKGSGEWSAFNAVRDDHAVGLFRVRQPEPTSRFAVTTIKRPARPQSLFFKPRTQH